MNHLIILYEEGAPLKPCAISDVLACPKPIVAVKVSYLIFNVARLMAASIKDTIIKRTVTLFSFICFS